jgi:mannose-6-phosphate isomerase-like protein (cupin superfamily)
MTRVQTPQPVSTSSAEHYTWGAGCDGWFLLKHDDFHVIQERMPPGTSEMAHHHERARQLFFVVRGELTMTLPTGSLVLRAGEALPIDPGTVHRAANESAAPVEFLVLSCPPSHGDRVTGDRTA